MTRADFADCDTVSPGEGIGRCRRSSYQSTFCTIRSGSPGMCLPRCLCKGAPEIDDAAGGKADDALDLLAFERRVGLGVRVPNREYCHQNESAESQACLKHRYPV